MAVGIAWTLFGALLLGVFALPSKYVKNYQWENTWGSFFLFAMYVVPVGFALIALKGLLPTYGQVPANVIFWTIALGFLWGCRFCCWGYSLGGKGIGALGTSVGFAIFQSGSLIVGNSLGFFTGEWKGADQKSKNWLFAGLAVLILGIVVVSLGNAKIAAMGAE